MSLSPLKASARHRDGIAIIDLQGEINRMSEEPLNAAYADATKQEVAKVLLNFDDVDYINSTGIAVIVGLLARARNDGRSVTACGLSDHYREIFEITRLSDFMTIFTDEENALTDVPA
ncbi:MAG: STAS domain-containing protein [Actinobacteria bacterium]|nr:STAS domain-containing protein [Actinomycetota bacterium]